VTDDIRVTRTEAKAEIVLDNPGRPNAVSARMWKKLRSLAENAREDIALRTLIIRGEGSVLIAAVKSRQAAYKIPKRIFAVSERPRNATGKFLKARLREDHSGALRR
jgi:enoyl-CoA hydratase/carnithine racemase